MQFQWQQREPTSVLPFNRETASPWYTPQQAGWDAHFPFAPADEPASAGRPYKLPLPALTCTHVRFTMLNVCKPSVAYLEAAPDTALPEDHHFRERHCCKLACTLSNLGESLLSSSMVHSGGWPAAPIPTPKAQQPPASKSSRMAASSLSTRPTRGQEHQSIHVSSTSRV